MPKLKLIVVSGPHTGQEFTLQKDSITIGRDEGNAVALVKDLRVSRTHAEVKWKEDSYHIINISSKNFILVDGEKVDNAVVTHKTRIQVGETDLVVKIPDLENLTVAANAVGNVVSLQRSAAPGPSNGAPSTALTNPGTMGVARRNTGMPTKKTAQPPQTGGARPAAVPRSESGVTATSGANAAMSPGARKYQQQRQQQSPQPSGNPGKTRFYLIVGAVLLIGGFFLFSKTKPKTPPKPFRSTRQIEFETSQSKKSTEDLQESLAKADTVQQRRAQENLLKGLRDFQQGQYARAKETFQVVLNLDPENQLAQRYYHLARLKFEEFVKWNLMQGQRYREKRNWRLCRSNYFSVMVMLQNNKEDPMFREAKQFHDECSLQLEGRY